MRIVFELMEGGDVKVNRSKAVVSLESALAMIEALITEAKAHFDLIREAIARPVEVR